MADSVAVVRFITGTCGLVAKIASLRHDLPPAGWVPCLQETTKKSWRSVSGWRKEFFNLDDPEHSLNWNYSVMTFKVPEDDCRATELFIYVFNFLKKQIAVMDKYYMGFVVNGAGSVLMWLQISANSFFERELFVDHPMSSLGSKERPIIL